MSGPSLCTALLWVKGRLLLKVNVGIKVGFFFITHNGKSQALVSCCLAVGIQVGIKLG